MPTTEQTLQTQDIMSRNYPNQIKYIVYSAEEEEALLDQLQWRCHTSMPIIKIFNFTYEDSKDEHAKICRVYKAEVEEISTHIKELNSLSLNEVLCLFTEYLLGMQVLCNRYNTEIKCCQVYFGLNKKGEPKLCQYPNQEHFDAEYSNQYGLQIENVIERVVNGILEIVYECFDPTKKKDIHIFEEIAERICGETASNFSQVQMLVRDLAKAYGIKIPLRIGSECKSLCNKVVEKSQKNVPEEKLFLNEELTPQLSSSLNYFNPHFQQKPLFCQPIQAHQLSTFSSLFTNKPAKESMATTNFSNFIRSKEELNDVRYLNKPQAHEIINNGKRIVDSVMVDNNMAKEMNLRNNSNNINVGVGIDNRYNFGGLMPASNRTISMIGSPHYLNGQSFINEYQHEAGTIKIQIPFSHPPMHHKILANPFLIPQASIASNHMTRDYSSSQLNYDPLNQKTMIPINNFMESGDLKESVWYGEDKKASFLNVKLEKLNGLGREIKTSYAQIE